MLLLAGYSLPHLIHVNSSLKKQFTVYLTLLFLSIEIFIWQLLSWCVILLLPTRTRLSGFFPTGVNHPAAHILPLLCVSVCLPYLLISGTNPLLQG